MANTALSIAVAKELCNTLTTNLDDGVLRIYDDGAPQPADPDSSVPSGSTMLSEHDLSSDSFNDAVDQDPGAQATANAITDAEAAADGTALWFRVFDSGGNAVIDGDVSEEGGGGDAIINTTSIVAGGTVEILSYNITIAQNSSITT